LQLHLAYQMKKKMVKTKMSIVTSKLPILTLFDR
jgi:hypothetical protein